MRQRLMPSLAVSALLLTAACSAPYAPPIAPADAPATARTAQPPKAGVIAGTVKAPPGFIGNDVGSFLGNDAGSFLGNDAGSFLGNDAGSFAERRVLALAESPLAGATVFLADAGGKPIPGLAQVRTDAQGRFAIAGVPAGYTFVVVSRVKTPAGADAALKTLANSTELGSTADIDTASTLVTTAAVEGRGSSLGTYNLATFQRAIEVTGRHLDPAQLPDLADTSAVLAAMQALAGRVNELESAVGELKSELADVKKELDALKAELRGRASTSPSPTATATAAVSASPSPSASPTASPSTSPAPSATPTQTAEPSQQPVAPAGVTVATLTGTGVKGFKDGAKDVAQFYNMRGIAVDADGNVYVADNYNQRVRKVDPAGTVSTVAGSGAQGSADGAWDVASFNTPSDVVVTSAGQLFITDSGSRRVRLRDTDGMVSTFAGSGAYENLDGLGTLAKFMNPRGLAIGADGALVLADLNGDRLRRVGAAAEVSTVTDAGGSAALALDGAADVAIDGQGNLYAVLTVTQQVVKITAQGQLEVLAGGTRGQADGTGTAAQFDGPLGIAIDGAGNVYVADTGNHRIRKVTPQGAVTTIAGSASGYADGAGELAKFMTPWDIEVGPGGKLYVSEQQGHRIRVITLP